MSRDQRTAAVGPLQSSIEILQQGMEVVRDLIREDYVARPAVSPEGSIGSHFRHCLDFYRALLDGLGTGRVDYDERGRRESTEQNPAEAVDICAGIIRDLEGISSGRMGDELEIRLDSEMLGSSEWTRSTVGRECVFLVSHTIHHYALMAMVMRALDIEPGALFGVAPSTQAHRQRTRARA